MSVLMSVFGNHKLQASSFEAMLNELAAALGTPVIDSKKGFNPPGPTYSFGELKLWMNHDFYRTKFENERWGVWLSCSHHTSEFIKVYDHSFEVSIEEVNTRYNLWQDIVSGQFRVNKKYAAHQDVYELQLLHWQAFRKFAKAVLERFCGDTLLYINDGSAHQAVQDHLRTGGAFSVALQLLSEASEGIPYGDLEQARVSTIKPADWFVETHTRM